jgi:ZIP family zinc transporter
MSTAQMAILGAIAGLTIFLGLPFARLRDPSIRLKTALNPVVIAVLIFLEWDILSHAWEPTDAALADHQWGTALVGGIVLSGGIGLAFGGLVS